jgi:hypothetical protein
MKTKRYWKRQWEIVMATNEQFARENKLLKAEAKTLRREIEHLRFQRDERLKEWKIYVVPQYMQFFRIPIAKPLTFKELSASDVFDPIETIDIELRKVDGTDVKIGINDEHKIIAVSTKENFE